MMGEDHSTLTVITLRMMLVGEDGTPGNSINTCITLFLLNSMQYTKNSHIHSATSSPHVGIS